MTKTQLEFDIASSQAKPANGSGSRPQPPQQPNASRIWDVGNF
ncbi:MAG: hypothetical protein OXQ96_04240 [Alphaproteobacteria bacterium]|nr:hypothetical protein [Alphaproteobacteria bacterium]